MLAADPRAIGARQPLAGQAAAPQVRALGQLVSVGAALTEAAAALQDLSNAQQIGQPLLQTRRDMGRAQAAEVLGLHQHRLAGGRHGQAHHAPVPGVGGAAQESPGFEQDQALRDRTLGQPQVLTGRQWPVGVTVGRGELEQQTQVRRLQAMGRPQRLAARLGQVGQAFDEIGWRGSVRR